MKRRNDLLNRLIQFGGESILFCKTIKQDYAGKHLASQLIRSATSPALNYSESQAAESRNDFIHKNKIAAKELAESLTNLKIIHFIKYGNELKRNYLIQECNELLAIVSTIIKNSRT
jgi:four helix bundle protein